MKTSGSNSWSYSYDYENRLKAATLNGVAVLQAIYDGDGRRVETISGDTTVYDYLPGSWNPAYVKDLNTNIGTDIIFANTLLVGKVQGATTSYYHLDSLGSIRFVTQQSTTSSFQTSYQPYGSSSATSGAETFQFTEKQLVEAPGLYYYGYRYYDSQTGRFITQDPGSADQTNPQSLNHYIYANDNPNRYMGAKGLFALECTDARSEDFALALVDSAMAYLEMWQGDASQNSTENYYNYINPSNPPFSL